MITPNSILKIVAENFEIDIQDITGSSRVQNTTIARHFFCLIMRKITPESYPSIGNHINRKHCSVIHGIKNAYYLIDTYPVMKSLYNKIIDEISVE